MVTWLYESNIAVVVMISVYCLFVPQETCVIAANNQTYQIDVDMAEGHVFQAGCDVIYACAQDIVTGGINQDIALNLSSVLTEFRTQLEAVLEKVLLISSHGKVFFLCFEVPFLCKPFSP